MPVTLALTPRPVVADRRTHAQRLHAAAEAVRLPMQTLWQTVLMDLRRSLSRRVVVGALQSADLLATEALWRQHWDRYVTHPIRQLLPALVTQAHEAGAEATVPVLRRLMQDRTLVYMPGLPAATQAITVYVGQQERLLWQSTLIAARQGLRWGRTVGLSLTQQRIWLQTIVGLTPRQVLSLSRLIPTPAPLTTMARVTVSPALAPQAARALTLRAQAIAAAQSMGSVNLGAQEMLMQAIQGGQHAREAVRRYWRVALTEGTCARCLNIAQTHPFGVAVTQPFQTYGGAVMFPPLHAHCACTVALRAVQTGAA